jgi:iron complex outermembrane receptor protein
MLNINFYWMNYKNQLVLTGELNDVGAPIRTNVDKSYRSGIEIEGMINFSNQFSWNANLTLSRNKIQSFTEILYDYGINYDEFNVITNEYTNTNISFSPDVIAGSQFTYKPLAAAEITLLTKYVGEQFLDNTSNQARKIDDYLINDLRFSYTFRPRSLKEITFSFLANNLFNTLYESNGYTYGYFGGGEEFRENFYYPQAGRNYMAMVSIRL